MRLALPAIVLLLVGPPADAARPESSWGKPGVGYDSYRRDSTECGRQGAGASLAGERAYRSIMLGLSRQDTDIDTARAAGNGLNPGGAPTVDMTELTRSYGLTAQRQQFSRKVATLQRFLVAGVERCLLARGYGRFALTRDQRRGLARYGPGTEARFRYLHALASDGEVLRAQAVVEAGQP